ncbi:uncharacterized protein LOC133843452 isoform X1 [Drosophila sulfurigaster albostrigata]|uniref:uncharacterized protein LOC133843452 isoform X1 n=1 Tax=Drosophila sulfurigaster albostrigata TaxID=89887 RepID=UPI002D21EA6C|nr:uncharacterized protein LOC133843452 isoform X1 [Drosophila sulfurigaster albostrigata]
MHSAGWICCVLSLVLASFEVTSIQFAIKDHKYAIMEKCHLRAVNRSIKLFDLRIKLLKLPITNVVVKWSLLKLSNGYLPFNHNYTLDGCKFLRHSNHLINNFIYGIFKDYTNLNHTCPYNHDVIVDSFPSRSSKDFDLMFLAKGDYAIDTAWYTDGILRADGRIKFTFA